MPLKHLSALRTMGIAAAVLAAGSMPALAQKTYDVGATDTGADADADANGGQHRPQPRLDLLRLRLVAPVPAPALEAAYDHEHAVAYEHPGNRERYLPDQHSDQYPRRTGAVQLQPIPHCG